MLQQIGIICKQPEIMHCHNEVTECVHKGQNSKLDPYSNRQVPKQHGVYGAETV